MNKFIVSLALICSFGVYADNLSCDEQQKKAMTEALKVLSEFAKGSKTKPVSRLPPNPSPKEYYTKVASSCRLNSESRALDIGFGNKWAVYEMAKEAKEVISIGSPPFFDPAAPKNLVWGDMDDLEVEGVFDVVSCFYRLQWLPVSSQIHFMMKALKPGGKGLLICYSDVSSYITILKRLLASPEGLRYKAYFPTGAYAQKEDYEAAILAEQGSIRVSRVIHTPIVYANLGELKAEIRHWVSQWVPDSELEAFAELFIHQGYNKWHHYNHGQDYHKWHEYNEEGQVAVFFVNEIVVFEKQGS